MLKRFVAFAFVSASLALAGEHWNVDAGDVSMKFLSMQVSARSAALSGAGTADAKSPSEISRNPLAMGAVQESEAGVNHVIFPENTADDFSTAYFALPFTLFDFPLTLFDHIVIAAGINFRRPAKGDPIGNIHGLSHCFILICIKQY